MKFKLCVAFLILAFSAHALETVHIIDNADLLSAEDKNKLQNLMESIASAYKFDLVIVTERNIANKSPMEYADDFFDYNDYGLGEDRDGCLFLVVTRSRDYWFSTSGRGIGVLNSEAFSKLTDDTLPFLREGDYIGAFRAFINDWETFLSLDAKGRRYNFFHRYNFQLIGIAWLVALLIGFGIVHAWKRGMNTALSQTQAAAYIVPGSLVFKQKKDRFLYSTVTKTRRQTDTRSGGGGGIHTGSSGRTHGGGGGRF